MNDIAAQPTGSQGFDPIAAPDAKVLTLGTLPGPESRPAHASLSLKDKVAAWSAVLTTR